MRRFEAKVYVSGCCNCTYANEMTLCVESQHLGEKELEAQFKDNYFTLTPTCPKYGESNENL